MAKLFNDALLSLTKRDNTIDINTVLNENISDCLKTLNITFCHIIDSPHLLILKFEISESDGVHWRFICTTCHILLCLAECLKTGDPDLLSVCQQKNITTVLQFVFSFGVMPSLIPGVGLPNDRDNSLPSVVLPERLTQAQKYSRLKCICLFFNALSTPVEFNATIFTHFLGDYLAALFQLCYAPLMKPNSTVVLQNEIFTMTEELREMLENDRLLFQVHLHNVIAQTSQPRLIKELVVLQGKRNPNPPAFMKKALTNHLGDCLVSSNGLNSVMKCFFDSTSIDIGAQWKQIDLLTRLIAVKHGTLSNEEYLDNICGQLSNILKDLSSNYVIVAAACATSLYEKYSSVNCVNELLNQIVSPLLFQNIHLSPSGSVVLTSNEITNIISTLDLCYTHPKLCLPFHLLNPVIYSLFAIRVVSIKDSLLSKKLNNLIMIQFSNQSTEKDDWFYLIIFGKSTSGISIPNNITFTHHGDGVVANKTTEPSIFPSVEQSIDCVIEILVDSADGGLLACHFFIFLLDNINKSKNFIMKKSKSDCHLEVKDNIFEQVVENYLTITKTLEKLINMDSILKSVKGNPHLIVKFIAKYLAECSCDLEDNNDHCYDEESITICLVLLSTLLSENKNVTIHEYLESIEKSTNTLRNEVNSPAIKLLSQEVYSLLRPHTKVLTKSPLDKAIEEVCDPLLPVRAHGLMQLNRLLEDKDPETISKKHYVLCIFKENLKDEDSYIYLAAINGLSSLAKYCIDDILEIFSKEFLSVTEKSNSLAEEENSSIMLRMKIGEILVKVTKSLGDAAVDHKNVLLNTFLSGCRDPEDLIRASSLSNLAELAQVLSYKLGSIIFDILSCINQIIQSDKSPECRRAAVMVISSLIKGLGKESLLFLKEALSPLYRTLKQLYTDEKEDTVVRLHAQIALEELNSIMLELLSLK